MCVYVCVCVCMCVYACVYVPARVPHGTTPRQTKRSPSSETRPKARARSPRNSQKKEFLRSQRVTWLTTWQDCTSEKWILVIDSYIISTSCHRLLYYIYIKRALWKRRYSAKETYNFKEPTNRSHSIVNSCDRLLYHIYILWWTLILYLHLVIDSDDRNSHKSVHCSFDYVTWL